MSRQDSKGQKVKLQLYINNNFLFGNEIGSKIFISVIKVLYCRNDYDQIIFQP